MHYTINLTPLTASSDDILLRVAFNLLKRGEQKLRIRIFDDGGLAYGSNFFLRVGYAPDIRQRESQPQYLTDSIKVPAYAQDWLTVYWDTTITFQAQVPWDYSERLAGATDLRTLPNLEEQVLKKYEQLRQNFIDCDVTEIVKQSAGKVKREYETNYIASGALMLNDIKRDLTIYAPNHPLIRLFTLYLIMNWRFIRMVNWYNCEGVKTRKGH